MSKITTVIQNNKSSIIISIAILLAGIIISVPFYIKNFNTDTNNLIYNPDLFIKKSDLQEIKSLNNTDKTKVTALVFTDTGCSFCKKFQADTVDKLMSKYSKTVDFKYLYMPFFTNTPEVAYMNCISKNIEDKNIYFNYVDTIFNSEHNRDNLRSLLEKTSSDFGLDTKQINQCAENENTIKQIQNNFQFAGEQEVNSTPQIFILKDNPENKDEYIIFSKIIGAREFSYFEKILDKALEK